MFKEMIAVIVHDALANGGGTYDTLDGVSVGHGGYGFFVSLPAMYGEEIQVSDLDSHAAFTEVCSAVERLLTWWEGEFDPAGYYLGLWIDYDTNTVYIDASVFVEDYALAMTLGKAFNQKAIYECASNCALAVV